MDVEMVWNSLSQYKHGADGKGLHFVLTELSLGLATLSELSPRPPHASAMTMVRSCHVVEDSINTFFRFFTSLLHICSWFFQRLCHVQRIVYSSHHHLYFNCDLNMKQELPLQIVLLQRHQALLDVLVLVRRRRRNRRRHRACWVHSFTDVDTKKTYRTIGNAEHEAQCL